MNKTIFKILEQIIRPLVFIPLFVSICLLIVLIKVCNGYETNENEIADNLRNTFLEGRISQKYTYQRQNLKTMYQKGYDDGREYTIKEFSERPMRWLSPTLDIDSLELSNSTFTNGLILIGKFDNCNIHHCTFYSTGLRFFQESGVVIP